MFCVKVNFALLLALLFLATVFAAPATEEPVHSTTGGSTPAFTSTGASSDATIGVNSTDYDDYDLEEDDNNAGPSMDSGSLTQRHGFLAIDALVNQKQIIVDSAEAGELNELPPLSPLFAPLLPLSGRGLSVGGSLSVPYSLSAELGPIEAVSASISVINETYAKIFSTRRSVDYDNGKKKRAMYSIIDKFREFSLQTFVQDFTASTFRRYRGKNIVAIFPGKNRGKAGDAILIVGAHWDTTAGGPGVDDNGSGCVALLELARLVSLSPGDREYTLMFVAFDQEEAGLLGSIAFVREYFVPKELVKGKATFLGAYIIDMLLTFDDSPNSQHLTTEFKQASPKSYEKMKKNEFRADFINVWMRKGHDSKLFKVLDEKWQKSVNGSTFKLLEFDPPLAAKPTIEEVKNGDFPTFWRSDHAAFWSHNSPEYSDPLTAVLLTDLGPWRENAWQCYHSDCDDLSQLTETNLNFLKHTIDVLYQVITKFPTSCI